MTAGPFEHASRTTPAHGNDLRTLQELFPGALVWHGQHTGHWWAMDSGQLLEGDTPQQLGDELTRARQHQQQQATRYWGLHPQGRRPLGARPAGAVRPQAGDVHSARRRTARPCQGGLMAGPYGTPQEASDE
jgi:hypothetical protein